MRAAQRLPFHHRVTTLVLIVCVCWLASSRDTFANQAPAALPFAEKVIEYGTMLLRFLAGYVASKVLDRGMGQDAIVELQRLERDVRHEMGRFTSALVEGKQASATERAQLVLQVSQLNQVVDHIQRQMRAFEEVLSLPRNPTSSEFDKEVLPKAQAIESDVLALSHEMTDSLKQQQKDIRQLQDDLALVRQRLDEAIRSGSLAAGSSSGAQGADRLVSSGAPGFTAARFRGHTRVYGSTALFLMGNGNETSRVASGGLVTIGAGIGRKWSIEGEFSLPGRYAAPVGESSRITVSDLQDRSLSMLFRWHILPRERVDLEPVCGLTYMQLRSTVFEGTAERLVEQADVGVTFGVDVRIKFAGLLNVLPFYRAQTFKRHQLASETGSVSGARVGVGLGFAF